MIANGIRTSLRSRVATQLIRGGGHHPPSPNGMNLPFNSLKPHFKYTYVSFMSLGIALPFIGKHSTQIRADILLAHTSDPY
ncbi:hypothetical protein EV182_002832 [Spiromyces aspiralis]|uniref:Uncharacterized protein n=1 Tax=Spiromyces aspiralis TaxID=68401 RepID=A0ACC1HEP5_9FUNG|nr:hypothetical protein EV182_002832 [Spiromyces aspiralis]